MKEDDCHNCRRRHVGIPTSRRCWPRPGWRHFRPPSPLLPPPCDCVWTDVDAGANPATLALGARLPLRRANAIRLVPPPLFTPLSLILTPLVLLRSCLFCPPRQQAMQQPAGLCCTPPPPPPTVVDLISLRFGVCMSLIVADCCLPPPPGIGGGCRKGLGLKTAVLLMMPW